MISAWGYGCGGEGRTGFGHSRRRLSDRFPPIRALRRLNALRLIERRPIALRAIERRPIPLRAIERRAIERRAIERRAIERRLR
ncbi:hypothetical protein AB0M36_19475 [Actinoplanes sp. NPDC051346]|uniref:hypothetical protein n=1 Tax=Actinoplanes sp. NPDC051346 TaxID=3155048 RepID=UPI003415AF01